MSDTEIAEASASDAAPHIAVVSDTSAMAAISDAALWAAEVEESE